MTYSSNSSSDSSSNGDRRKIYSGYPEYTVSEIEQRNSRFSYDDPSYTESSLEGLKEISSYGYLPPGYLPEDIEFPEWWEDWEQIDWQQIIDDIVEKLPGSTIEDIQELIECVGEPFQLDEGVKTYDTDELNANEDGTLAPQFPNCPDKELFYDSGWQVEDDVRVGTFTGAIPAGVKRLRASDIGTPLKTSTTESHNPGRYANLPNSCVKVRHAEALKILWCHPFLERGDIGFKGSFPGEDYDGMEYPSWAPDIEYEWMEETRDVESLGFSFYNDKWTWQSGPPSNTPTNSDGYIASGFWTNAGGLSSIDGEVYGGSDEIAQETSIRVNREFYDYGKTSFKIGYSRGDDTTYYGDSPTEGLEYGVVGLSGWVSALPNESWKDTKYNTAIQHVYTINRICTDDTELKANINAFIKWLEYVATIIPEIPDLDINGDDNSFSISNPDYSSYSFDPDRVIERITKSPDEDFTEEQSEQIFKVIDRVNKLQDRVKEKVKNNEINATNFQALYNSGRLERFKKVKFNNTQAEINALSLIYEFVGRFSPRNAGLKESEKHFDISPADIFDRAEKGIEVTAYDVIRNFATRLILEDETLALQFGDLDIEKLARYGNGELDEESVRNEKFFVYLVHNHRDDIQQFYKKDGEVEVLLRSGFLWKAGEFIRGKEGFFEACDRNECDMFVEDGEIFAIPRRWEEYTQKYGEFEYAVSFKGDFERNDYEDNPFLQEESSLNSVANPDQYNLDRLPEEVRAIYRATDWRKKNLLPPEGGNRLVDWPEKSMNPFQRWDGGYAYPAASNSARPDWGNWAVDPSVDQPGYDPSQCDPKDVWKVHTYGPFMEWEMKEYYYFIIPLRRAESPRMDYGLYWWWADNPDDPPEKWSQRGAGAKNPLDAYAKWIKPKHSPALKNKVAKNWKVLTYYKIKPPKKYFRVAFYRWNHNTPRPDRDFQMEGQGQDQIGGDLLDPTDPVWKEQFGPKITQDLYPPKSCNTKPPGQAKGKHPHGVMFPFTVTPAKTDNPYADEESEKKEFKGLVYWTDTKHKVAELGNPHYKQPVNIHYQDPNDADNFQKHYDAKYYEVTPVTRIDEDLIKDQDCPQMSIHYSFLTENEAKDPTGYGSGHRAQWTLPITWLRRKKVIIRVPWGANMSVAGWYPDIEIQAGRGGRSQVDQWNNDGEPWIKLKKLTPQEAANGPGYLMNTKKGLTRPTFFSDDFQKPLNFWGEKHHLYQNPINNTRIVTPVPGKRYKIKTIKNTKYEVTNPVDGKKMYYYTQIPCATYFCLDRRAQNPILNPEVETSPKPMFKWAGHIYDWAQRQNHHDPPKANGMPQEKRNPYDHEMEFTVTAPTDMMIFGIYPKYGPNGSEINPNDFSPDGVPIFLECKEHTSARDALKGPAYHTSIDAYQDYYYPASQRYGYRDRKVCGENGYVHFHSLYWNNPLTDYNSTVPAGGEKIVAGREYTATYTPGEKDTGEDRLSTLDQADNRVRIIFGKKPESLQPVYENDPGFTATGEQQEPDETLYSFTDIVLEPGKPTTFTAETDIMFFGVFNVDKTTANPMGTIEGWSRFGQPIDVKIEGKKTIRGCSLYASSDGLDLPIANDNRTWQDLNRYKTPYTHLTKEIGEQRGYKKDGVQGAYDGGAVPLVAGRKYRLSVTDWTPINYQYRIKHIRDDRALQTNNLNNALLPDHTDDNLQAVALEINGSENDPNGFRRWIEFTAVSPYIMLEAFRVTNLEAETGSHPVPPGTQSRPLSDFSDEGEPAYLKLTYAEADVIEGRQYWTDLNDPNDAKRAAVLKDKHWKSPLSYIKHKNKILKANTKYEIEIIDRDDNPDYLHELWIGPNPQAYNTNQQCSYTKGPALRKGDKAEFKTGGKNVVPIIGCSQTNGRTLASWNDDGEPIFYKLKELYTDDEEGPVYPANLMDRAPANWNQYTNQLITQYGEEQIFANPLLNTTDPDADPVNGQQPYRFTKINVVGEAATDQSPAIVPGARYRISYDPTISGKPEDYKDELPYVLRVWECPNMANTNPGTFAPNKITGGRVYYPQHAGVPTSYALKPGNYMDFMPRTSNIIFGAAKMGSRQAFEWSEKGEPINLKIERLPAQTSDGPSYPIDRANKNRPPAIENPYFLKPINFQRVKAGDKMQFKPDPNISGNFDRKIWWILDNRLDKIPENDTKNEVNSPLTVDPLHPEDLYLYDRLTGAYKFNWEGRYQEGPELVKQADGMSQQIDVPAGVTKCIISVYPKAGYNPGAPGGASVSGASASTRSSELDALLNMWGNNGEPMQGDFIDYRPEASTEGPVYWGDGPTKYPNTDRKKHEFLDSYWDLPLRMHRDMRVKNRYEVTKKKVRNDQGVEVIPAWDDYETIDIYAATYGDMTAPSDNDFKYLGTFNETDDKKYIEIPAGYADLIFSAYNMKGTAATKKTKTDWSIKGDVHPFAFKKLDKVEGPCYWADTGSGTSTVDRNKAWAYGKPKLDLSKWKKPLMHYLLEDGATYEMKLHERLPHGIHCYFANKSSALDPSTAKESDWTANTDLDPAKIAAMQVGDKITFGATGKYLIFGATLTDGRTLDSWSPYGEPDPFRIKRLPFPEGPGYPAMDWGNVAHQYVKPDLPHPRFNKPVTMMKTPKILGIDLGGFIPGMPYKFKYKGQGNMDFHYELFWMHQSYDADDQTGIAPGPDQPGGRIQLRWDQTRKDKKSFTTRALDLDVIYALRSKTGSPFPAPQTQSMSAWSPAGHPVPYKASVDWFELIPKSWWKWLLILLGLLALLLGIYAHFRSLAPTDVLLQMAEEHEGNEYPLHRYKRLFDDEGNAYGYGYPNDMELLEGEPIYRAGLGMSPPPEGFSWAKNWDTKPKFINYTADYSARAWARIMKLRHNGYWFHMSRNVDPKREDLIQGSYTKHHIMTFANLTQTFGIGYSKLNTQVNYKFKKVFRDYKEFDLNGNADRDIDRYNPYNFKGVKRIKIDSNVDPLKQRTEWNNDLEWFDFDHQFIHFCKQDTMVETFGGVKYRSGETLTSSYDKLVGPAKNKFGQRAMFTELGMKLNSKTSYSNFTSSHNIVWEWINGDSWEAYDNWSGVKIGTSEYFDELMINYTPIIEFDLISKGTQINQVHVNYERRFFGEVIDRKGIQMILDPSGPSYQMMNSMDNNPSTKNYGQGNVNKLRLIGKEPQELGLWRFCSISICYSVNTGSETKEFGIKNLRGDFIYDKMDPP